MSVIYGMNPVTELLESDSGRIEKIVIARGRGGASVQKVIDLARLKGIRIEFKERGEVERIGGAKSQGILCFCKDFAYSSVDDVIANRHRLYEKSLILILDSITDPQNLGSLVRSGCFFGANGIIIPADRAAPVTPAAIKASAGAAYRLPVAKVVNIAAVLDDLKKRGFWIYGTDPHGGEESHVPDYDEDIGLVMGSEGRGIRPLVKKKCDRMLFIGGAGQTESLNVAVAAGIVLHQISLKRIKR
ncbi:MAG: 23S rRNA (guanosine(2251)-2'-O)-methyltransferase RlmB [Syntrophales bacterium]